MAKHQSQPEELRESELKGRRLLPGLSELINQHAVNSSCFSLLFSPPQWKHLMYSQRPLSWTHLRGPGWYACR